MDKRNVLRTFVRGGLIVAASVIARYVIGFGTQWYSLHLVGLQTSKGDEAVREPYERQSSAFVRKGPSIAED